MAFKVDVPIAREREDAERTPKRKNEKESDQNKQLAKETKDNTKEMKTLVGAVTLGNVLANLLTGALEGIMQLISPLVRILSALFIVVFMPLIPLLTKLIGVLSEVVSAAQAAGGGPKGLIKGIQSVTEQKLEGASIWKRIGVALITGLVAILAVVALVITGAIGVVPALIIAGIAAIVTLLILAWDPIIAGLKWFGNVWKEIGLAIWGAMKWTYEKWQEFNEWLSGLWSRVWAFFVDGLSNVLNFGQWIWNIFKEGLRAVAGIGKLIYDTIKSAVTNTGSSIGRTISTGVKNVVSWLNPFQDFIQRPGQNPVSFSPNDTIIGVKDTRSLGGSSITINIHDPIVRDDTDLRRLTEMVSQNLQRQGNRRFSGR